MELTRGAVPITRLSKEASVRDSQYVILEWVEDLPDVPRYGFATIKHAEELGDNVKWHQLCSSLEQAAASTQALNHSEDAVPA
jgi:hypothetical protein